MGRLRKLTSLASSAVLTIGTINPCAPPSSACLIWWIVPAVIHEGEKTINNLNCDFLNIKENK